LSAGWSSQSRRTPADGRVAGPIPTSENEPIGANGVQMTDHSADSNDEERAAQSFEHLSDESSPSTLREIWDFLRENKAWWLGPIVAVLLLVSLLVILGASGAAPLIYTLF